MFSPKPTRRSTRLAHRSDPVPLDAYLATPEDSVLVQDDSLYVGEYQPTWARAMFPQLYPPSTRSLTRPSRLRPVPVPHAPEVLPVAPLPVVAPLMGDEQEDDTFTLHWTNFPPVIPSLRPFGSYGVLDLSDEPDADYSDYEGPVALIVSAPLIEAPKLPVRCNKRTYDQDMINESRRVKARLCF